MSRIRPLSRRPLSIRTPLWSSTAQKFKTNSKKRTMSKKVHAVDHCDKSALIQAKWENFLAFLLLVAIGRNRWSERIPVGSQGNQKF